MLFKSKNALKYNLWADRPRLLYDIWSFPSMLACILPPTCDPSVIIISELFNLESLLVTCSLISAFSLNAKFCSYLVQISILLVPSFCPWDFILGCLLCLVSFKQSFCASYIPHFGGPANASGRMTLETRRQLCLLVESIRAATAEKVITASLKSCYFRWNLEEI